MGRQTDAPLIELIEEDVVLLGDPLTATGPGLRAISPGDRLDFFTPASRARGAEALTHFIK